MDDIRGRSGEFFRRAMIAVLGLVCVAAGVGVAAQAPVTKTTLLEPPTQLLPQRFGTWEKVKSSTDGSLNANEGASGTVLKEDGLERFASSTYKRDGSGDTISMQAFQFYDTTGAVAAYTYIRTPEGRPAPQLKLGTDASMDGKGLLFREGATVVVTDYKEGIRATDLAALSVALPKAIGPTATAPLLPTLLPAKGLDAESVRYALGPASYAIMGGVLPAQVVGFDKSAEVVTAKYRNGGVLTLLLYPTPQIAGEYGRAIEAAMNQPGAAAAAGTVKLRREGPLLALTTGAWTPAAAQAMVEAVHLHTEVSFDKPMPLEFHAEIRKTYSLLESIVIFCGISAVAMVVLGLFLGGGRALIRVMQGKPAATEPEFLHIDLSGPAGKRLGGPEA
jgi:hypothetical protein